MRQMARIFRCTSTVVSSGVQSGVFTPENPFFRAYVPDRQPGPVHSFRSPARAGRGHGLGREFGIDPMAPIADMTAFLSGMLRRGLAAPGAHSHGGAAMRDEKRRGPHGGGKGRAVGKARCGAWGVLAVVLFALCACGQGSDGVLPGYVEGEFVYVASKFPGRLDALGVSKGGRVEAGAPLFTLEHEFELQAVDIAKAQLAQAEDTLRDRKRGLGPRSSTDPASLERTRAELALMQSSVPAARSFSPRPPSRGRNWTTPAPSTPGVRPRSANWRPSWPPESGRGWTASRPAQGGRGTRPGSGSTRRGGPGPEDPDYPVSALFSTPPLLWRMGRGIESGGGCCCPGKRQGPLFVPEVELARIPSRRPASWSPRRDCPNPCRPWSDYVSTTAEYAPPVIFSQGFRRSWCFWWMPGFSPDVARTMHPGSPWTCAWARAGGGAL